MTDTQQERIEKLQKILAKAERAGTQEEAEVYFAKAQELMTKWSIDALMLQLAGKEKSEKIVTKKFNLKSTYYVADVVLLNMTSKVNDCVAVDLGPRHRLVTVSGYETDVRNTEMLFTSLLVQVARAAKYAVQPEWDYGTPHSFRKSFRFGFCNVVRERLLEKKNRAQQDAAETYGDSLLPAIIDKNARVKDFVNDLYVGGLTESKTKGRVNPHGWDAGAVAGASADIGNTRIGGRKELNA